MEFDIAVFDEASQITGALRFDTSPEGYQEGCDGRRSVRPPFVISFFGKKLTLFHSRYMNPEWRPTSANGQNMAKIVRFDISFLERLYSQPDIPGWMVKTMLDVQYRSPKELNVFPSKGFYERRLKTNDANSTESLNALKASSFPWPVRDGIVIPAVVYSVLFRKGYGRPVEEQRRPSRRCASCVEPFEYSQESVGGGG